MQTLSAQAPSNVAAASDDRAIHKRLYAHYLLAIVSLSVYGGQVCPFVESLGFVQNALPVALLFLLMSLIRPGLYNRYVTADNCQQRMAAVFKLDLGLYLYAALIVGTYYWISYDFPPGSGLKIMFGFGLLGIFAALDMAAVEERHSIDSAQPIDREMAFVSVGKKIVTFTTVISVALVVVMLLLVVKDLEWLLSANRGLDNMQAAQLIALEFFIVLGLILGSTANVVGSYSRNLGLRLQSQSNTLAAVSEGRLQRRIHDVGNDELTRLSTYINQSLSALEVGHRELSATRDLTIRALSSLAETRDNETGLHIIRTQHYVKILANRLRNHPDFAAQLNPAFVELLYKSAPLHDIGKIGIPDHILLKPGKLTDDEFEVMKTHAELGRDALKAAAEGNEASAFLCLAQEIALNHHEKWDGKGYPNQLAGEDIPLSARLMALADVYDALISKRVYKKAMSHQQAKDIITDGRGSHFDPRMVDAFLSSESEFIRIAEKYGDK